MTALASLLLLCFLFGFAGFCLELVVFPLRALWFAWYFMVAMFSVGIVGFTLRFPGFGFWFGFEVGLVWLLSWVVF